VNPYVLRLMISVALGFFGVVPFALYNDHLRLLAALACIALIAFVPWHCMR
jgi:cyanate permease